MLSVDVYQFPPDQAQTRHCRGTAIDPAEIFPVRGQFPLDQDRAVLVGMYAALRPYGQIRRNAGKGRADKGFRAARADQIAGRAPA